jgi:hypothetical protein
MNVKLLIGIALFVIGVITAGVGIVGVGRPTGPEVAVQNNQNAGAMDRAVRNGVIPAVAGLSLAIGGLLIGLSMGNWKHPRTHIEPGDRIVDPEGYHKMKHV